MSIDLFAHRQQAVFRGRTGQGSFRRVYLDGEEISGGELSGDYGWVIFSMRML